MFNIQVLRAVSVSVYGLIMDSRVLHCVIIPKMLPSCASITVIFNTCDNSLYMTLHQILRPSIFGKPIVDFKCLKVCSSDQDIVFNAVETLIWYRKIAETKYFGDIQDCVCKSDLPSVCRPSFSILQLLLNRRTNI